MHKVGVGFVWRKSGLVEEFLLSFRVLFCIRVVWYKVLSGKRMKKACLL